MALLVVVVVSVVVEVVVVVELPHYIVQITFF